jgi:hypothetical protein
MISHPIDNPRFSILVFAVAIMMVGCGREITPTRPATALAACRRVPADLPEELRRLYGEICAATNAEDRIHRLVYFPRVQLALAASETERQVDLRARQGVPGIQLHELIEFLPLLSEIMATGDYSETEGRRSYVAENAASIVATAGTNAVPFAIKALQSDKPVEVVAGLRCAEHIVGILEFYGKTNDLSSVCSDLIPYVRMCATNGVSEAWQNASAPFFPILDEQRRAEQSLISHLPPTSPMDTGAKRATSLARQYRGLTEEFVRTHYRILQETNQVPRILDVQCVDERTGDRLNFAFEHETLYEVDLVGTNRTGYHIFFNKDGTVLGFEETFGADRLVIDFYDGERLQSITHYTNETWCDFKETFSESGELISSNRCGGAAESPSGAPKIQRPKLPNINPNALR